ncbi:uncharacterized protein LOC132698501 [Cylas formicarius]|uniref:uncharacterized protein LOC132698501 n=1 Tax=Cylas formicarius TaxID=197179 RepID=UPI00295875D0|nr:uncharacterized protein LOC132698501 [Cylas formicarius]
MISNDMVPLVVWVLLFSFKGTDAEIDICLPFNSISESDRSIFLKNFSSQVPKLIEEIQLKAGWSVCDEKSGGICTTVDYFDINFSHPALTLFGNFKKMSLQVSDTSLKYFHTFGSDFQLVNITFGNIAINGTYNWSGFVGANELFDIYGSGPFWANPVNFSVGVNMDLNFTSPEHCLAIEIRVYLPKFNSNFSELMNGDDELCPLLNGAISDIGPDAVRIIWDEYVNSIDGPLPQAIDKILEWDRKTSLLTTLINILELLQKDVLEAQKQNIKHQEKLLKSVFILRKGQHLKDQIRDRTGVASMCNKGDQKNIGNRLGTRNAEGVLLPSTQYVPPADCLHLYAEIEAIECTCRTERRLEFWEQTSDLHISLVIQFGRKAWHELFWCQGPV